MNDDGFTYVEVITAVFIFSLTGFLVWSGLTMGISAVEKIRFRISASNEISRLEYEFRHAVNSLETDYWAINRNNESLKFTQDEDRLVFTAEDEIFSYSNLHFISLEYRDNCALITFDTKFSKEVSIIAHWGSFFIGGDD